MVHDTEPMSKEHSFFLGHGQALGHFDDPREEETVQAVEWQMLPSVRAPQRPPLPRAG